MDASQPNFDLVWNTLMAYQRTAALRTALEIDVFTHIGAGATAVDELANRCGVAARGLRPLLNRLVGDGFVLKQEDSYQLTPTAAVFLDRSSQAFVGSASNFITSPLLLESFWTLTESVRRGGTAVANEGTLAPEHPIWVEFARAMGPFAALVASLVANALDIEHAPAGKVLDISAGHGMFGITLARMNPSLQVTGLDWPNVLQVAEENARAAGVADRYHLLPGNAFEVAYGNDYQLILLPNFLHHFDAAGCETILRRVRAALAPTGKVAIVELVPNDDRVTPPEAAAFALVMLASTPAGDAHTFREYQAMLKNAGFGPATMHELAPSPMRLITA